MDSFFFSVPINRRLTGLISSEHLKMGGKLNEVVESLKSAMAMVLVQAILAGVNIFYKLAKNDGMEPMIVVAYRYIFAAAVMAPLALILERYIRLFSSV